MFTFLLRFKSVQENRKVFIVNKMERFLNMFWLKFVGKRRQRKAELMSDPCFSQEEAKFWESWWVNSGAFLPGMHPSTDGASGEEPACQSRRPKRHG